MLHYLQRVASSRKCQDNKVFSNFSISQIFPNIFSCSLPIRLIGQQVQISSSLPKENYSDLLRIGIVNVCHRKFQLQRKTQL